MRHRTATRLLDVRAGDVIEGTEGEHLARLRLLYVSRQTVLAMMLNGTYAGQESTWTLTCRDWRVVRRHGKPYRDTKVKRA